MMTTKKTTRRNLQGVEKLSQLLLSVDCNILLVDRIASQNMWHQRQSSRMMQYQSYHQNFVESLIFHYSHYPLLSRPTVDPYYRPFCNYRHQWNRVANFAHLFRSDPRLRVPYYTIHAPAPAPVLPASQLFDTHSFTSHNRSAARSGHSVFGNANATKNDSAKHNGKERRGKRNDQTVR